MQITIDCPGCGSQLRVPKNASGRRARCPACKTKFVVPSVTDLLEDTVSNWIVEDLDTDQDASPRLTSSDGSRSSGTVIGLPAVEETTQDDQQMIADDDDLASDQAEAPVDEIFESVKRRPDSPPPQQDADQAHQKSATPSQSDASEYEAPLPNAYPNTLEISEHRPHLLVQGCSQVGVTLTFESRWLTHLAFRASLPVRCAFTGLSRREELIIRPMIFLKHFEGKERSAHALEQRYERRFSGVQSPRELVLSMDRIDGMIEPFNHPPIYYSSKQHAGTALSCQTRVQHDGSFLCDILMPDNRTALEWLGRVNGVCGADYELLERDVAMLGSDAWRQLSEKCRERLAVWCKFQPREHFQLYINDVEFSSADSGLAGVVVTDHRLIYHKYHHRGEISLSQEATLHVKTDGRVARIAVQTKGRLGRVGKIHTKDMARLVETLSSAPKLKIQLASGN